MIRAVAERSACHPVMEQAILGAIRSALPDVIESVIGEMFPGETVRLYGRKTSRSIRTQRDDRIAAAIKTGEPQKAIARRECVSLRHVERISAKINRQSSP